MAQWYIMARTLSEHDIALLLKLAPECDTLVCKGSENTYRSILPPVANHYAKDADDFAARLNKLSDDEFLRLIDMIREGKEGIGCIPVECAEVLIEQALRRAGPEAGNELYALYEAGSQCQ
ncbi:hypothetical protein [Methanorbis furvi]|uniref:Uncharacterized protein n=1 Tax=Methanorbis furvi TaxID=3028299 RepID=A0AAE4ME16_9EURY|nr:hypothetical protein [Methanocorpusculaceae archaeon Ag1]